MDFQYTKGFKQIIDAQLTMGNNLEKYKIYTEKLQKIYTEGYEDRKWHGLFFG